LSDVAREAKELIDQFAAAPRFAGSEAENRFRDECEKRLTRLGFTSRREDFTYSQLPAKLGPLICGSLFAAGMYLSGHLASSHRAPGLGIGMALLSVVLTWIVGALLLRSTLTLPVMRAGSTNLIATRGVDEPRVWLVAHTDSKSQTIRMLVRVGSIVAAWILFVLAIGTMLAQMSRYPVAMGYPDELLPLESGVAAILAAVAILPVALCFIGNDSRGALDNASGVAAVLLALDEIQPAKNIGVLFTSAEELGLAGARAFLTSHLAKGVAINCDTIDDRGTFVCMTGKRKSPAALALGRAGSAIGHRVKIRSIIPGILTDSIPFSRAGWDAVTLSRGNLGTLSAVHTSGDEPGRIDGAGIALAARVIAATIEELA
jgi:hypothetical protein